MGTLYPKDGRYSGVLGALTEIQSFSLTQRNSIHRALKGQGPHHSRSSHSAEDLISVQATSSLAQRFWYIFTISCWTMSGRWSIPLRTSASIQCHCSRNNSNSGFVKGSRRCNLLAWFSLRCNLCSQMAFVRWVKFYVFSFFSFSHTSPVSTWRNPFQPGIPYEAVEYHIWWNKYELYILLQLVSVDESDDIWGLCHIYVWLDCKLGCTWEELTCTYQNQILVQIAMTYSKLQRSHLTIDGTRG